MARDDGYRDFIWTSEDRTVNFTGSHKAWLSTTQGCPYWSPENVRQVIVLPNEPVNNARTVYVKELSGREYGFTIAKSVLFATKEDALYALYERAGEHLGEMQQAVRKLKEAYDGERG